MNIQAASVSRSLLVLILGCSFCLVSRTEAADSPATSVTSISGGVDVDGVLDEPTWSATPLINNLTQVEPRPGEPPTEATLIWLARSSDALYIAVRCDDSRPEAIVGTEMGRSRVPGASCPP